MAKQTLRAVYNSPDNEPFEASADLVDLAETASTETKIQHLEALRTAIRAVQADVNRELTARMVIDADRAQDAAAQKEEANYGEEMVE